jgi:DNA-binding CsgD family transcriptional regulator
VSATAHRAEATAAGALPLDPGDRALLERDDAAGEIADSLDRVKRGSGVVLFVVGAAGIGKTSVVRLGRRAGQAAGFSVGPAVGSPMEVELPFGLISQAIVALGGADVEDVVDLARLGGQPARFYRTLRWLSDKAAQAPLLLALDDLHWADRDSLELLGFLARRLSGAPVLVLGSLRPEPDPAHELAAELARSGHARMLQLGPLSREAAATLLARVAGRAIDTAQAERIWRACAGTPLLLELAGWSLDSGVELPPPGSLQEGVPTGDGGLSATRGAAVARRLLLARFVGLGADAFAYVRAAAIFGVRFAPSLAGALAGLSSELVQATHAQLLRAGLVEDLGAGRATFVHPLFAQTLLDSQPASEREGLHAEAFRLLVAEGAPDALAAEHAVAAGLVGDPLAVEVSARAGRAALAQGALEAACAYLASAARLAGEAVDVELLLEYASALAARGRIEDARAVCDRMLARPRLDAGVRARALALLARGTMLAGRPDEAERLYDEAAEAAWADAPASAAPVLIDGAVTCHVSSPMWWLQDTVSRALELLPAGSDERRHLEFLDAYTGFMTGDPSGTALIAQETQRHSWQSEGSSQNWAWTPAVHVINVLKLLEDLGRATEIFERQFERAVEEGAPVLINALALVYADVAHRLGRPREALELVERAIAISGVPMAPWMDVAESVLLTELGRDDDAQPHIEVLRAAVGAVPPEYYAPVSLWLDLLDARRLLACGEPGQASATMLHAARTAELTGWRHPCIVPWAGVAIEAHLAAGRPDLARTLMGELEELSRPLSCRWPRAQLEIGHARLAAAAARREEADRHFERALAILAELPLPIARAEALLAYGVHLRHSDRPRAAREHLVRALDLAEHASSEAVARVARGELAAAGGRRRRRTKDPCKLTAQEDRVAALAAEGLTNAQIAAALYLSPKTVGHHLGHIYAKLGISSRRDLIGRGRSADLPAGAPAQDA